MAEEQKIRAFLAIDPPEKVRESLGRIQDRLKKIADGGHPLGGTGRHSFDPQVLRGHLAGRCGTNIGSREAGHCRDRAPCPGDEDPGGLPRCPPSPCRLAGNGRRYGTTADASGKTGPVIRKTWLSQRRSSVSSPLDPGKDQSAGGPDGPVPRN